MQFAADEVAIDKIDNWRATIEQVRDACLEGRIIALNVPSVAREYWFSEAALELMVPKISHAVRSGRLIDCGDLPNAVIKTGGKRGGMMYNAGLLAHPFSEPWVLYHTWEAGCSAYLIELCDANPAGGATAIVELCPMMISGQKFLCAGDQVLMESGATDDGYHGFCRPSTWRIAARVALPGSSPEASAMNNCLDPFVTALLLLHTDGVPVESVIPPEKLNKARLKSGKLPLPSRLRIISGPYVTALLARHHRRREAQGGTHGSPVPHLRIGHWRYFADGRQPARALACDAPGRPPWRIRIRDALVNVKDEARAAFLRSHYVVKR